VRAIQKSVYAAVEECKLLGIKHCSLMPGCVETLVWIRSRVIAMGVATSDSEFVAEKVIEGLGVVEIIGGLRELPAVIERLNGLR
jgi:phosphoglycolate phosphatase-like HAD superfamily hydrolase